MPMFAPRLPAHTIGRLRIMLAHPRDALLQQNRLASGLGVSSPAVDRCIDLLAAAPPQCVPYFYRSHAGAEVDLVLERAGQPWMAIEIKRSSTPALSKGFGLACDDLQISHRYVVYPGGERFAMRQEATAISLPALMQQLQAA